MDLQSPFQKYAKGHAILIDKCKTNPGYWFMLVSLSLIWFWISILPWTDHVIFQVESRATLSLCLPLEKDTIYDKKPETELDRIIEHFCAKYGLT